jgi:hypothetical protein
MCVDGFCGPEFQCQNLLPVSEDGVSAISTFNGHFSRSILMEHLSKGFTSDMMERATRLI